jgi:phosphoribosylamine--glycine ligase
MVRLKSDLAEVLEKLATGQLSTTQLAWSQDAALCVVLASAGYPGGYETGKTISGLAEANALPGVVLFHAGTQTTERGLVTAGGRVLGVTAHAGDLAGAMERAYRAVDRISFEGMHFRRDIGARRVNRLETRGSGKPGGR